MKLLQIDSSARAGSVTRRLTAKFADRWQHGHPTGEVIQRDLPTTWFPLITDEWNATQIEPSKLSASQRSFYSPNAKDNFSFDRMLRYR
jgi:FMN-dependent NADH-azoreductase